MTLRVTVLGGAAAWPNPGQGCSSYLVDAGETAILLDCGPDTLATLRARIDYHRLDAVVLSHWHSDHVLDMVPYRYGLVYGPGTSERRIPLWVPTGVSARLDGLSAALTEPEDDPRAFWDDVFDRHEYDAATTVTVGSLRIDFDWTQHYVPCLASRVTDHTTGRSLAYSADAGLVEPLVDFFRGVDLAIIEGTLEGYGDTPPNERGHLTPEDAGRLAQLAGAAALLVTHLWSERDPETVRQRAASEFDGRVMVARPGMTIDV